MTKLKDQMTSNERMAAYFDGLSIEYGLHGIGQACGTKLGDNENSARPVWEKRNSLQRAAGRLRG